MTTLTKRNKGRNAQDKPSIMLEQYVRGKSISVINTSKNQTKLCKKKKKK